MLNNKEFRDEKEAAAPSSPTSNWKDRCESYISHLPSITTAGPSKSKKLLIPKPTTIRLPSLPKPLPVNSLTGYRYDNLQNESPVVWSESLTVVEDPLKNGDIPIDLQVRYEPRADRESKIQEALEIYQEEVDKSTALGYLDREIRRKARKSLLMCYNEFFTNQASSKQDIKMDDPASEAAAKLNAPSNVIKLPIEHRPWLKPSSANSSFYESEIFISSIMTGHEGQDKILGTYFEELQHKNLRKKYETFMTTLFQIDYRMEERRLDELYSSTIHNVIEQLDDHIDKRLKGVVSVLEKQAKEEYVPWSDTRKSMTKHLELIESIHQSARKVEKKKPQKESSTPFDQSSNASNQAATTTSSTEENANTSNHLLLAEDNATSSASERTAKQTSKLESNVSNALQELNKADEEASDRLYTMLTSTAAQLGNSGAAASSSSSNGTGNAFYDTIPNLRKFKITRMKELPRDLPRMLRESLGLGLELV